MARVFLRGIWYSSASFCKVFALYCALTTLPFKVQQQAQIVVNFANLTALLCLLSANDRI